MLQLPLALKLAEQHKAAQAAGQNDLFGMDETASGSAPDSHIAGRPADEWDEDLRLQGEKETLGLYLTGHPIERYRHDLQSIVGSRIGQILEQDSGAGGGTCTLAGLVVDVRHGTTQRGRMGSMVLDDRTGRIEVTLFTEQYERWRDLMLLDRVLVVTGNLVFDEFRNSWSLRADRVQPLEEARESVASHLQLRLDQPGRSDEAVAQVARLKQVLQAFQGGRLPVQIEYRRSEALGSLRLGREWCVRPTDELLTRMFHKPPIPGNTRGVAAYFFSTVT